MRVPAIVLSALFLVAVPKTGAQEHHHELSEKEVGSVRFATSCAKSVELAFNRAVALLHSFQYEKAREAFLETSRQDPQCAMAYWGVAMSHYHGLWDNSDWAAGQVAISRAREIAAANARTTQREKTYIDAVDEVYRQDGKSSVLHAEAFERKMGEVQSAYPDDSEAAIFHALALDITAPKTDRTFANQRSCGEILEPILHKLPHHPGVAHYLIHCYDNPALAEKALVAARTYAKIAPASAHANHMPSHIFTRVGSWEESIRSNNRSKELATKDEMTSLNGEARDQRLHAMDYLEYAYLQSGRVSQANQAVAEMQSLKPIPGLTLTGDYALAAIPARYFIELGKWDLAAQLSVRSEGVPWAQAITWTAIGVGSARSGDLGRAATAEKALAALRDETSKQSNTYWANQVEVQRREVAAWISEKNGKGSDSIAIMRTAAELEESMDKHAVTPGAITPAREMLAQLLALEHQPVDSLVEYEAVLKVAPNRFNALYGAATAAEAAGNPSTASRYFRKLTEIAVGDERQELVTARKKATLTADTGAYSHP